MNESLLKRTFDITRTSKQAVHNNIAFCKRDCYPISAEQKKSMNAFCFALDDGNNQAYLLLSKIKK